MLNNIKLYQTYELSDHLITKILNFKDTFWKFGINSQKDWFKKNIKNNYLHSILFDKDENIIGYGVKRIFHNYNILDSILVSQKYRNKSIGSKIIKSLINTSKIQTFLLCEKKNIYFYQKNSFRSTPEISFSDKEIKDLIIMSINYDISKNNSTFCYY